ncbi:DUF4229 domain-containing protein [Brevibacterium sp. 50QC2O2]|jgi:protein-S-isoprenylcysteine O-methyltransferase Ste14|uniref:DUF4229 domain-containing protein n=1 Tax=Brevibacterium TaxID=1696 RepID=UPI00211D1439|nr:MULTISPECIES: DUF4229 domain-containing protein [unclassified Brevibacterium]MCQ9368244.1 DUF4229 domain-containing protein [Brevibacterium sp. 91QC2O2]MCQ9385582.1 DUF4229 domain-containing protein [Brevibacterium sp. 68QC2CO]MCQ9389205.1 DUF4229 domain-containing protein [Brevibacterium sp. 50QC2O2]
MRQFLLYNLARIGLFVLVLAVMIGIFKWSLITGIAAILISTMLSYLLLGRLRDSATNAMVDRVEDRRKRKAAQPAKKSADAQAEDAEVDQLEERRTKED